MHHRGVDSLNPKSTGGRDAHCRPSPLGGLCDSVYIIWIMRQRKDEESCSSKKAEGGERGGGNNESGMVRQKRVQKKRARPKHDRREGIGEMARITVP